MQGTERSQYTKRASTYGTYASTQYCDLQKFPREKLLINM